jgi:hypothetical protein
MRVDRLAIIGVMNEHDVQNNETEAGAYGLLGKYTGTYPDMPWTLQFVKLGATPQATEWDPQEDKEISGQSVGFDRSEGSLGVYVLAHGSLAGLSGVVDAAKFCVMLKHFDLLSVKKLCLIACVSAGEPIIDGNVVGNPSTLWKLCQYLGAQGCRPVMAGWNSFVTVVSEEMFKKNKEDTKPMTLGEWKSKSDKAILNPKTSVGKKAVDGPRGSPKKILASNPLSENKEKKKLFYMYKDGAMRVAYADWTDKRL